MANDLSRSEVDRIVYACRQSGDDSTYAIVNAALASTTGEAEPVAEDAWPKLDKPAMVGGGSFGKGVTTRFVVEAAQRLYEREAENRSKTPEQRIEDERNRRAAWDLFNGNPFAATPAAPGEVTDALADFLEAQDALDNREYQGINGEDYSTLMRRRNSARAALDAALAHPAPVAEPARPSVHPAIASTLSSLEAEVDGGWTPDAQTALRKLRFFINMHGAAPAPASEAVAWNIPDQCPHMIVFDDAEASPLTFAGSGARPAALEAFKRKSIQWNAHLFVRIAHNSRDDTYPDATPGDSADASVQQAREAQTALLIEALEAMLSEAETHCRSPYCDINFEDELLEKARAALKGEQPAQPSGSERGEV